MLRFPLVILTFCFWLASPASTGKVAGLELSGARASVNALSAWDMEIFLDTETYIITATAGPNGSIDPSGQVEVEHGDSQTFTIAPNTGYNIANVWVDGTNIGVVESYTFENVTSNHTISAAFSVKTYSITAGAGPNGTIHPSGLIFVSHGSSLEFTITPDENFFIDDVLVDGESVGAPESYTFSNISQSHTIQALFDANRYTVEFEIFSRDGDFIPDAVIIFNEEEYDPGVYIFTDLLPGEYFYYITREGYFPVSGSLNLEFDTVWTIFMDEDDTADETFELTQLRVFPNPAGYFFNVNAPDIILGLQVVDMSGRILRQYSPGTSDLKVNTDLMEPGIYLLRLTFDRRVVYHKIQVQ